MFSTLEEAERRWKATPRWKKSLRRLWHRFTQLPSDTKWFFFHRFHPSHRYNVVKTGLRPGYHDFDTRMEAAIVRLFLDYVKEETRFGWLICDETVHPETAAGFDKIKALYEYFKNYDPHCPPYKPNGKKNRELRREFDEKLVEVVRLRDYYWT